MAGPKPIYMIENCRASYHLTWSVALFWHEPMDRADWVGDLKASTERDAVRVLEHRYAGPATSQFLVSTRPESSPASVVRSVKGRLQRLVRDERPKAFRRNYSIRSVGSMRREAVERYVSEQLAHHRMADPAVQEMLRRFQIAQQDVDLSAVRRSSYGEFLHNLHIVLVNDGRYAEVRRDVLEGVRRMILGVAAKKGHLLSRAGIFADHVHLSLGCGVAESPGNVALAYMNNLAYAQGMRPVFQFGYYAGTFGEYDFGALRK